jgi:hypothetical protein
MISKCPTMDFKGIMEFKLSLRQKYFECLFAVSCVALCVG